jgi:hypothetical protein
VARQLNHTMVLACLCCAVTHSAWAQSPAALKYSDPNDNRDRPRVIHYRVGTDDPQRDAATRNDTASVTAASAAESGALSPYVLSARVVDGQSFVRAVGGYDTAAQAYRARSSAESSVTRFLAVRVDFEHGPSTTTMERVSLGARLQLLSQKSHGLDLGLGAFYQPNDFRREGNVVGGLVLGYRIDRVALFGSGLVGSDPEGDDQELDGRLGTLIRVNHVLQLGWDGRFRSVLSVDNKRIGTSGVDWELALLPSALMTFGPVAVIGEVGFSALQQTDSVGQLWQHRYVRTGLLAMAGMGAAF